MYIDTILQDAGWVEGRNWQNEVALPGMPNRREVGYADYVLYGDDGRALAVIEAKRSFVNLLPDLSVTNLCEEKGNLGAYCVFSTYQTMMNCIDEIHDDEGKLFTVGHFKKSMRMLWRKAICHNVKDIFSPTYLKFALKP